MTVYEIRLREPITTEIFTFYIQAEDMVDLEPKAKKLFDEHPNWAQVEFRARDI